MDHHLQHLLLADKAVKNGIHPCKVVTSLLLEVRTHM
jgi:hypothetical protein